MLHLARRFFGALWPARPKPDDLAWVMAALTPGELTLWGRMPNHDQRHSIGVAREVARTLDATEWAGDSRWIAAALLHDVGKLDAHLGVYGRVMATVAGGVAGHDMADAWSAKSGFTRRAGLYLRHGELGADIIRMANGREEAAAWAAAHHDPSRWDALSIPGPVAAALNAADND